jgi:hypothetical protein
MRWLIILLALAGCEQRYRYACQNPENWESAQCQKPLCEVNQDCPDHVFIDQKRMDPYINKGAPAVTDTKETDKGVKNDCAK